MANPPTSLRAAVAGATGYIGMQTTALLSRHPQIEVVQVSSRSTAGKPYSDGVPGSLLGIDVVAAVDPAGVDVIFACLPHGVAGGEAEAWMDAGAVVVDMSADFRITDTALHEQWYGPAGGTAVRHRAAYGLVEVHRDAIRAADLLAIPGCYPTASLLATLPAVAAGAVEPVIVIDAKSGVSGAGRSPSLNVHFSEANESVKAYGVDGHRHKAEMIEQLSMAAETPVAVTFVPHLIPMTRGILATAYLRPRPGIDQERLREIYADFAIDNPFIRIDDAPPPTKSVYATNVAALHVGWQDGVAVVTCAIDNLVKGAAGQGIQACNVRHGFDEGAGLLAPAIWP